MSEAFKRMAAELSDSFETRKRDNGDEFICRKDDAPEWVEGVCHSAHGDMSPDDWRYRFIRDAAYAIHESGAGDNESAQDAVEYLSEYAYYSEGYAWLASGQGRSDYADEAASENGNVESINDAIFAGMWLEALEVLGIVAFDLGELASLEDDDE